MGLSILPQLYLAVLEDPDASEREDLRRGTEAALLGYWRTLLRALPSRFDPPEIDLSPQAQGKVGKREEVQVEEQGRKDAVRREVEQLARGMVIVGVPEDAAWEVVLEWLDGRGAGDVGEGLEFERYRERFPE